MLSLLTKHSILQNKLFKIFDQVTQNSKLVVDYSNKYFNVKMSHINRRGGIGRSRKFKSLQLKRRIKANPYKPPLNRERIRRGRIKAKLHNYLSKPGSIRHGGMQKSPHNQSSKPGGIFRGLFNMAKCKACTGVMRSVVKAAGKDSGKVHLVNYFIIMKSHTSFDFCLQRGIVKALDKACSIIPIKKYRSKCHDSVRKEGEEIADLIANKIGEHVDAKKICKFLKLC